MIELKDIEFSYREKQVLQNISFSVKESSFFGVVGPNGSGKTTLFNLITGNLSGYKGNITLASKDLRQYTIYDVAKVISVVPQNMAIRFPYTCLEIVMMGRTPYKSRLRALSDRDMELVHKVMVQTDTLQFAHRSITELSGGEQQRVFLAKALAQQPRVLFLDEAFANMDIYYSVQCLNLLKELAVKEGLTVVAIMHDLNLVSNYCTHVALLNMGKLVRCGETLDVMNPKLLYSVFRIKVVQAGAKGLAVLSEL